MLHLFARPATAPASSPRPSRRRALCSRFRTVWHREDGALLVFGLFCFVIMLILAGIALDVMHAEQRRTSLQNTLDRAVLAAADLHQTLPPKDVVTDYFTKAGLAAPTPAQIDASQGADNEWRRVQVSMMQTVPTMFMRLVGTNTLPAPALGAAEERVGLVEISLVLDVSGSMNSNSRLTNLKPAAKAFIDQVFDTVEPGKLTVSIIPYATQVNMGAGLMQYFNVTDEHNASHCIEFDPADYAEASVAPKSTPVGAPAALTDKLYQRNGHFDGSNAAAPPRLWNCATAAHREILPLSGDRDKLKTFIDNLAAEGFTSIDIGMKWGAALVDPSMQPVVARMATAGTVDAAYADRPLAYDRADVLKVVVIMTDGENTTEWRLRDAYDHGPSRLYRSNHSSFDGAPATLAQYSLYDASRGQYYLFATNSWRSIPYGDDPADLGDAVQLSWPQVWERMSIDWFANRIIAPVYGNTVRDTWRSDDVANPQVNTYVRGEKDARALSACSGAKNAGTTVFAIGFEAPQRGLDLLKACASSPAHFYSVSGLDIATAFAGIASSISKLRLTE